MQPVHPNHENAQTVENLVILKDLVQSLRKVRRKRKLTMCMTHLLVVNPLSTILAILAIQTLAIFAMG
jgi:hypothetical protein